MTLGKKIGGFFGLADKLRQFNNKIDTLAKKHRKQLNNKQQYG
jgi:hypothetical protein